MKSIKKVIFLTVFLIFSHSLFAQTSLCNSVFNYLKKTNCNPTSQSLVSSSVNYFPYNLSVDFPAKNTPQNDYFNNFSNLFLIFNQEEVEDNKDFFTNLLTYLKQSNFNFNITLLFAYGEKQIIEKEGNIYGTDTFLNNLNTNTDSTAIIFNLDKEKSSIISTSSGLTTPSWLIKNEHDIYKKYKISPGLPLCYISQMYNSKFNVERQLDSFFANGIPTIILNFNSNIDNATTLLNVVTDSIESYAGMQERNWDQHFLMVNIFGHYLRLAESQIVHIIIFIILASVIFIALLGFINNNFKFDAWQRIKKIWYVVPITFIIVFISLLCGKGLIILFQKHFVYAGKIYFMLGSSIAISLVLITVYYCIQLYLNNKFPPRSIDFMITITLFINQFFFSFIDISLFPLFMFACIVSIIALIIKNNVVHILLLLLVFYPFCVYAHAILNTTDSDKLFTFLNSSLLPLVYLGFVLYPLFLMYFSILTALKQTFTSIKSIFIAGSITLALALIVIIPVSSIRTIRINNRNIKSNVLITRELEDVISISYSDKKIFNDTIRKLTVTFDKPCYQCDVSITNETDTPIYYSSDDFQNISSTLAFFSIPSNPPQNLTFNYGTPTSPCTVKVTAIFATDNKEKFSLTSKSITINE